MAKLTDQEQQQAYAVGTGILIKKLMLSKQ